MRYFISLLGLALVVGAGYFAVAQYVSVAHGQSGLIASNPNVSADGAQVLALLNRLQGIHLDGRIFQNPNFNALQDWSVDIAPQTVGRPNPYLLPAGAVVPASGPKVALPRTTR